MKNKEKLNVDEKPATAAKYRVMGFGMIASLNGEPNNNLSIPERMIIRVFINGIICTEILDEHGAPVLSVLLNYHNILIIFMRVNHQSDE